MGIGMVADFMAGGDDFSRYLFQSADVAATHEEGRFGVMIGEQFEQGGGRFAGAIVESEGQRGAFSIAVP